MMITDGIPKLPTDKYFLDLSNSCIGPFWSRNFYSGSRKNSGDIGLLKSKPKYRKAYEIDVLC